MKEKGLSTRFVLIIGSSNMDLNIYLERLPQPGETVTGGIFKQFLGGKGANQAVASTRSGAHTVFIGKIGEDAFGRKMEAQLMKEGVNINYLIKDSEEHSGVAFIMIDNRGENMISVAPGANYKFTPPEIKKYSEIIQNATALVVQMELPVNTIEKIFSIASRGDTIKILNPAPLKPISAEMLQNIDILVPNEGELVKLAQLLGFAKDEEDSAEESIVEFSKHIANLGPRYVITTLGKKGCVIYDRTTDKVTKIPSFKVEAVDTVGAGDCFNGVLASNLCKGKTVYTAVKYATAAASIAVTRKGAQESMPYEDEIEKRYKSFKQKSEE
ncbi:MAG: ribokinase [Candidatus Lokiarchaeota archaeon]|nr:ribokinase [Candidatus Lokiarchaeota archaeon]MBD3337967.1 ribokinase [Candidatus Lokiarchaeota archaeon]